MNGITCCVTMLEMSGNNLFKNTFRVPSARLQEWDYAATGFYFVTICTKNKRCWLGTVKEIEEEPGAITILSDLGRIAEECWLEIPVHYPNVILDEYVIMPNHIHGIIMIHGGDHGLPINRVGAGFKPAPTFKNP